MNFYSLNKKAPDVSFKDAVIKGLAPDRGLYFPKSIKPLTKGFFKNIEYFSNEEIAYEVIKQFVADEIPERILKEIIKETINFDFPVVAVEDNIATLELFHGPTMAFKDVGARFMARCLGYFNQINNTAKVTVLVATSGDTGGAVASGFLGVEGVDVVILYPSGKVSEVQEKQLTTLGKNITAIEVNGTFDDCQTMVKNAFLDTDLLGSKNLTSANSINVARWLPQMFYFFFAYKQLKNKHKQIVFSVPSGNFGNICAGLMAQQLGLPVKQFIASTNINDIIPNYMNTGVYQPKPSKQTISNAMDVGDPSNFVRILEIFKNNSSKLKDTLSSYSFTDNETKEVMKFLYEKCNYITDPHGAVGYLGLKKYGIDKETQGIFLETAHPVKFLDVVSPIITKQIELPKQILKVIHKEKRAINISTYEELKAYVLKS
ncbi:threonine synthase [Lutibacter aestuarii]|uniref:Threonine synthase n=1 Tax=Lutibacter aestuarii TaxID=861111 RepID=A0ABW2Z607_9FLAO